MAANKAKLKPFSPQAMQRDIEKNRATFALDNAARHLRVVFLPLPLSLPHLFKRLSDVQAAYLRICSTCCREDKEILRWRMWYCNRRAGKARG